MHKQEFTLRNGEPDEFKEVGKLKVQVYFQLEGFPKETKQPDDYKMLIKLETSQKSRKQNG